MNRFLAALVVTGLVSACTAPGDEPSLLLGGWGGPDMIVVGTTTSATVQLPCMRVTFPVALRLDQRAGFTATGNYTSGTEFTVDNVPVTIPIRVVVTPSHDTALVNVQTLYNGVWGGNDVYRVVRGAPLTLPDGRICAN